MSAAKNSKNTNQPTDLSNVQLGVNMNRTANSEDDDWRAAVTRDIAELRNRINLLEFRTNDNSEVSLNAEKAIDELKHSDLDYSGTASRVHKLTCKRLTPVVALQSFWMFACLVIFLSIGISQFITANANSRSHWKPEKKTLVIDYTVGNPTAQYDMPIFWLTFGFINNSSQWSDEMMNETLTHMLQNHRELYIANLTYVHNEKRSKIVDCEADSVHDMGIMDQRFWATLGLKCENPGATFGDFYVWISMNMFEFSTLRNVDRVTGLYFIADRHLSVWYNGPYLTFDTEHHGFYGVEYWEDVVDRIDGRSYYIFETNLQWQDKQEFGDSGEMLLMVKPDLSVDHWTEYVSYGYVEWLMAMGGLLSVCAAVFFFGASRIALAFDGSAASMGILPVFSYTFYNYDKVVEVVNCVNKIEEENLSFRGTNTINVLPK